MIRKLRVKFILAAMLSLFLVLTVIIGAVNILNYCSIVNEADNTLLLLKYNDGRFPVRDNKPDDRPASHNSGGKVHSMSPEFPYESRFFSVIIDENGSVVSSDTEHIAAVDGASAASLAKKVISAGKSSGFIKKYRYLAGEHASGTQVIFLDCTRDISTFRSFLFVSCGISLAGLTAVFILIVLWSGRFIKPVLESYEKQKRFITDAGHEIKTPVTIIDADAEILEMELSDNEWLQDIRFQTKRLASLTNDLIFLSRMDEEHAQLHTIDFPLSDLVSETALSFQSLAKTQQKEFVTDIEPLLTMNGDEKSLRQLVSILLDNALKYSPENGRITLSLHKAGKIIHLTVTNTAEAVTKENLSYLFDRFYRTDQSRNSQTGGFGIGLSIAKAVVTAHKGKITATTADGSSLTIDVIFPRHTQAV